MDISANDKFIAALENMTPEQEERLSIAGANYTRSRLRYAEALAQSRKAFLEGLAALGRDSKEEHLKRTAE